MCPGTLALAMSLSSPKHHERSICCCCWEAPASAERERVVERSWIHKRPRKGRKMARSCRCKQLVTRYDKLRQQLQTYGTMLSERVGLLRLLVLLSWHTVIIQYNYTYAFSGLEGLSLGSLERRLRHAKPCSREKCVFSARPRCAYHYSTHRTVLGFHTMSSSSLVSDPSQLSMLGSAMTLAM